MRRIVLLFAALILLPASLIAADSKEKKQVLTGKGAFTDAAHESPGTRRHLTAADLPAPAPDQSVDNGPTVVRASEGRLAQGARGIQGGTLRHRSGQPARAAHRSQWRHLPGRKRDRQNHAFFAVWMRRGRRSRRRYSPLACNEPFGIAFYPLGPNPQYLYVGDTDQIVRFPYHNGDLKATGTMDQYCRAARRRASARRRPLDARPGVLKRWLEAVRVGRVALECGRSRHAPGGV